MEEGRRGSGTVGPTDGGHRGCGGSERCRRVDIVILKIIDGRRMREQTGT
jgi:hypothetical protein